MGVPTPVDAGQVLHENEDYIETCIDALLQKERPTRARLRSPIVGLPHLAAVADGGWAAQSLRIGGMHSRVH